MRRLRCLGSRLASTASMPRSRPLDILRFALVALLLLGSASAFAQGYGKSAQIPDEPCFGAAARDPQAPCTNKKLRLKVIPKPADAVLEPNSPCRLDKQGKFLYACHFGAKESEATRTVALVGDSHAAHLRATLDAVVADRKWAGVSMTRAGCPFTKSATDIPKPLDRECATWKPEVRRYLRRNPEISTIFVSANTGVAVKGKKGAAAWREKVDGYAREWRSLPTSVKHVIVVQDTPRATSNTMPCVENAMRAKQRASIKCAVPRSFAVRPDAQVFAAKRFSPGKVQVVDLNDLMCSNRMCFPVIGGSLVHKDVNHLTQVFATTLGPYLLRDVLSLMSTWDDEGGAAGAPAT